MNCCRPSGESTPLVLLGCGIHELDRGHNKGTLIDFQAGKVRDLVGNLQESVYPPLVRGRGHGVRGPVKETFCGGYSQFIIVFLAISKCCIAN